MKTSKRNLLLGIAGVVWFALSVGGLAVLSRYAYREGGLKAAPPKLPVSHRHASAVASPPEKARLLMFLHPECPCSEATAEELNRLVATEGALFTTTVYLHTVGPHAADVADSPLGRAVSRIPGVEVRADAGGAEARRFGAETSGTVLLYDARGDLRYQGGLTESRGHMGDNENLAALRHELTSRSAQSRPTTTHVFGCSIF